MITRWQNEAILTCLTIDTPVARSVAFGRLCLGMSYYEAIIGYLPFRDRLISWSVMRRMCEMWNDPVTYP